MGCTLLIRILPPHRGGLINRFLIEPNLPLVTDYFMPTNYFDNLEIRTPEQRESELLGRLPALISLAKSVLGWQHILKDVSPEHITSRAALALLPVTRKSGLQALQEKQAPFGGLVTRQPQQLRRLFMSPGPIFDPEGHGADWWRFSRPLHALGVRSGAIIQNCFSYHFTPAAFMVESAAQYLGCTVIPAGVGQTEMQVQAIAALRPQVYAGTPSFLKLILEKAQELGADISSLKYALVGAEALPPSLRQWLQQNGVERVLQMYASADIGNIAYETVSDNEINPGMILDEELLLEIVRPGTGDVLAAGEVGEVVITSFNSDYPLIRFATGDLSAILPGISPCGRTNQRLRGWLGRADQTTKIRAMFVHPSQISDILRRHPEINKARLEITGKVSRDIMTLYCEVSNPDDEFAERRIASIISTIRDVTKLRADVKLLNLNDLPNDGRVIADLRDYT